jgi:NAD(P)H-nitrite reductase large subunit
MTDNYIVIGDGVAGATAAEEIREVDEDADVKVFTDESEALYNRIMLKSFMKNELPDKKFARVHDEAWYVKRHIDLHLETRVGDVDTGDNIVISESGEKYSYDKLLVATGGSPRDYPLDEDYENLHYMWTMKDAEEIKRSAEESEEAVVIGGGLLGIDLAVAYAKNDCETYYLIRDDRWWHRGISMEGAEIIHRKLEEKGVNVLTETEASEFVGSGDSSLGSEEFGGVDISRSVVARGLPKIQKRRHDEPGAPARLSCQRTKDVNDEARSSPRANTARR